MRQRDTSPKKIADGCTGFHTIVKNADNLLTKFRDICLLYSEYIVYVCIDINDWYSIVKIDKTPYSRVDRATGKSEVMIRFVAARLLTLRAHTDLFVPPERWNEKTGDVRISTIKAPEQKESPTVQRQLAELSNLIFERFSSTEIEEVTKAWLEQVIDEFHHPEKYHAVEKQARVVRKQTVLKYLDLFIEETPQRRHKQTGRLLSTSTPRVYKTMRRHLFEFARTIRKKDFEFDEIDMKFYNRLVINLQAKQFTANTVGKIIKELKTVLRQAEKDGVNPNTAYKDFTVYTEAVDNVYLSEELEKIRTADLNVKPQEVKKTHRRAECRIRDAR